MNKTIQSIIFCLALISITVSTKANDLVTRATATKIINTPTQEKSILMTKLKSLPLNISDKDTKDEIISKIESCITNYKPDPQYKDDLYIKATIEQAIKSIQTGGYGIGAVIVDNNKNIVLEAHNQQLQEQRSDLHAEMNLLNKFENTPHLQKYRHGIHLNKNLILYSSTEPCPMCFTRLLIVGIESRYGASGPDDGMASRSKCLPNSWKALSEKCPSSKADSSPILEAIAHLLFYSYLLN